MTVYTRHITCVPKKLLQKSVLENDFESQIIMVRVPMSHAHIVVSLSSHIDQIEMESHDGLETKSRLYSTIASPANSIKTKRASFEHICWKP
jgi:hypothetical protein